MCTSVGVAELNRLVPVAGDAAGKVTLEYGGYMNWGRLNENSSRIMPIVSRLNAINYEVQLSFLKTPHVVRVIANGTVIFENPNLTSNYVDQHEFYDAVEEIVKLVKAL